MSHPVERRTVLLGVTYLAVALELPLLPLMLLLLLPWFVQQLV